MLNICKVMFEDSSKDYSTPVAPIATEASCKAYFVGNHFNVGNYPNEEFHQCIAIEFTDNNKSKATTQPEK